MENLVHRVSESSFVTNTSSLLLYFEIGTGVADEETITTTAQWLKTTLYTSCYSLSPHLPFLSKYMNRLQVQ